LIRCSPDGYNGSHLRALSPSISEAGCRTQNVQVPRSHFLTRAQVPQSHIISQARACPVPHSDFLLLPTIDLYTPTSITSPSWSHRALSGLYPPTKHPKNFSTCSQPSGTLIMFGHSLPPVPYSIHSLHSLHLTPPHPSACLHLSHPPSSNQLGTIYYIRTSSSSSLWLHPMLARCYQLLACPLDMMVRELMAMALQQGKVAQGDRSQVQSPPVTLFGPPVTDFPSPPVTHLSGPPVTLS